MRRAESWPAVRLATLALVCLAAVGASWASGEGDGLPEAPLRAESDTTGLSARAFEVRYRPLTDVVDLVSAVLSAEGSVAVRPRLSRLVVQDRPEVLDRVGALIESYDLPPRNVEVTVSLFLGSDLRREEAGRRTPSEAISRELRGVRETLGDFTKWTVYDPLGSRSVTAAEGQAISADFDGAYRVMFEIDAVRGTRDPRIEFRSFSLVRVERLDDGAERTTPVYSAGLVLTAGRELIVGAASGPESKRALFLKVLAKPR